MPDAKRVLSESPSQTAGPYVHIGCTPNLAGIDIYDSDLGRQLCGDHARGQRIVLVGTILDGAREVVRDAMVEIWQADAAGRFAGCDTDADPAFAGFGRAATDPTTGAFHFDTIKPGRVAGSDSQRQAPHISMWIVARGINIGLQTRVYFADEAVANAEDPVLWAIAEPERRKTLIAHLDGEGRYQFDVVLQGVDETVFFDV